MFALLSAAVAVRWHCQTDGVPQKQHPATHALANELLRKQVQVYLYLVIKIAVCHWLTKYPPEFCCEDT
jgi:hypothetical protein